MHRYITLFLFLYFSHLSYSQNIKSPDEFLGYELGTEFTYHHKAVEYFRYVADTSPLAEYMSYGSSYEGRPLGVCIISFSENLADLDTLRKNNLVKTGLTEGVFSGRQLPFIWLSYNVHGNEAVGMEAAMKTLHAIVSGSYPGMAEYLRNCIIIIDPCQNPDGHELYVQRYRNSRALIPNPDRNAWEHNQGWPGARANHYMFDLNRDWTWQTQAETRQRLNLYNRFMPHVHADFHEMGPEATFFFAPGAEPWHTVITPWQNEFHKLMGKANAGLFDEMFRLYFTKESFDLFYPSYGDTWPLFNGAMGFTFEQAGGGVSGLSIKLETGDTLTLKDRIEGHFTAAMATIKVSFENRAKLISEFNRYFEENEKNPAFQYKSVIIKGSNEKSNLRDMLKLLDHHQIKYNYAAPSSKKMNGFDYAANKDREFSIDKGDILISSYQPQSRFVQVLFEPDSRANDSVTYDLSAWALPYVYNLRAYALKEKINPDTGIVRIPLTKNPAEEKKPYAYIADYKGFDELKLIAALHKKDIRVRYALKPFTINGKTFERGSYIIARGDNRNTGNRFDEIVRKAADESFVRLFPVNTGLADSGRDLGSSYSPLLKRKNIAMLCGEGTSASATGELWYFFERELEYPVTLINTRDVLRTDFSDYDLLILTSGSYSTIRDTVIDYVKKGGKVLAMENAISLFNNSKLTALGKALETKASEEKAAEKKLRSDDTSYLKSFEYTVERRYAASTRSAGGIYRVEIDETHPYAFGLGSEWFIMKRTHGYPYLPSGNNIGYLQDKEPVSGFAGFKYKEKIKNTLVIGSENIGRGEVIYISDNPYFRAFWKSGRVVLGNVVLR